jgi:hypothetical protein
MSAEIIDKTTAYTNLALAIVLLAAEDYREAQWQLSQNPHDKKARDELKRLTRFFKSQWGEELCLGRADYILDKLQKESKIYTKVCKCGSVFADCSAKYCAECGEKLDCKGENL